MGDILDLGYRKKIIDETQSEENKRRKEESLRRWDIYQGQQRQYILRALINEFSQDTVADMRTFTSINLTKRITDEQAAIYKIPPERTFQKKGGPLAGNELLQVTNLYELGKYNVQLKKANKAFKLNDDEIHIQVIPKDGKICWRVLFPHHLDVVPDEMDPTKAKVYVISNMDRSRLDSPRNADVQGSGTSRQGTVTNDFSDSQNQSIGDSDDWRIEARFAWWSDEYNFISNGWGDVIDKETGEPTNAIEESKIKNPVEKATFVRIGDENDFEYWRRAANGVVDFNIDYGVILSDTANVNRLQGHAQAIIYSDKIPNNFRIGPNIVLHLPIDKNKEIQPRFEFVTPNTNMNASLDLLEAYLRMFLSSQGMDAKMISGKADGQRFNSGIERLLSMIERFDASRDDFDAFRAAEQTLLEYTALWSNAFQGANIGEGNVKPLVPDLQNGKIPGDVFVDVKYAEPEAIQTKSDEEESVIRLMENGLLSKSEAIQLIRQVDEETALNIMAKIAKEEIDPVFKEEPGENGPDTEDEDGKDSPKG